MLYEITLKAKCIENSINAEVSMLTDLKHLEAEDIKGAVNHLANVISLPEFRTGGILL